MLLIVRIRECDHDPIQMIIDAGHFSIGSNLVDKMALQDIKSKRNRQYDDSDYKHLESLVYDRFIVKLKDAQVCSMILHKININDIYIGSYRTVIISFGAHFKKYRRYITLPFTKGLARISYTF